MRHGGDLAEAVKRYGIPEADWLDLSTGINPRPWPAAERLGPADLRTLSRLPSSRDLDRLLAAARAAYAVPAPLAIAAAPGTEILIRLLPLLSQAPSAVARTTYSSHLTAFGRERPSLVAHDADALLALHPESSIAVVNPNNPDGRRIAPADLVQIAGQRSGQAVLLVDEAYADAEDECSVVPLLRPDLPILVLKSFGKFFGLPGLRLGFAIGPERLVAPIRALLGDWPVSAPAITIGAAALADLPWQSGTRDWLEKQSERLISALLASGLSIAGSSRLCVLAAVPDAPALHRHLAEHGIWTRIFSEWPGVLRIGLPGTERELGRLASALAR
ncbi:aminotransferase class I/II-fold pyridoxal phosphate-dependent enzyme [Faunimonas sp. B44]|uniref:aminotransferase class I/II-fold pyridoxal phosphate-dependent enzyme n=1 Tax=Faunimonas sp. B44 TaxID=3461493 RepID=UPI004045153E